MITACKTVSILDSMFCSYRFPVLNHISFNTQSLYLLSSVYPSMFLIYSSFCCCFAKMRRRMDRNSLKMHTSSLSECCIWRSTVNVLDVFPTKLWIFFGPENHVCLFSRDICIIGCSFIFLILGTIFFLKKGPLRFSNCWHKKRNAFLQEPLLQKPLEQSDGYCYSARDSYFFWKENQRDFFFFCEVILDHCE